MRRRNKPPERDCKISMEARETESKEHTARKELESFRRRSNRSKETGEFRTRQLENKGQTARKELENFNSHTFPSLTASRLTSSALQDKYRRNMVAKKRKVNENYEKLKS